MPALSPDPVSLPAASAPRALLWRLVSPAERELLPHLCLGLSNKEIAAALGKAPGTVKAQLGSVLKKLELPTRGRLVAWLHLHHSGSTLSV